MRTGLYDDSDVEYEALFDSSEDDNDGGRNVTLSNRSEKTNNNISAKDVGKRSVMQVGNGKRNGDGHTRGAGVAHDLICETSGTRCFVLDTSALLETDVPQHILEEAVHHLLIIPKKVREELEGLWKSEGSAAAKRVLDLLNEATARSERELKNGVRGDARFAGGVRWQTAKQVDSLLSSVARNNDDHILSCASYFHRHFKDMPTYFVTCDVVLSLKAHAEGIPVTCALQGC